MKLCSQIWKTCSETWEYLAKKLLRGLIKTYKVGISPFIAKSCRFYPTCSSYAQEALEKYSLKKAVPMIIWRVCRCNPFSKGGFDPVDKKQEEKNE